MPLLKSPRSSFSVEAAIAFLCPYPPRLVDPLRNVFRLATMLNGEVGAAKWLDGRALITWSLTFAKIMTDTNGLNMCSCVFPIQKTEGSVLWRLWLYFGSRTRWKQAALRSDGGPFAQGSIQRSGVWGNHVYAIIFSRSPVVFLWHKESSRWFFAVICSGSCVGSFAFWLFWSFYFWNLWFGWINCPSIKTKAVSRAQVLAFLLLRLTCVNGATCSSLQAYVPKKHEEHVRHCETCFNLLQCVMCVVPDPTRAGIIGS